MLTKLKALKKYQGFMKYFKNTSWLFAKKILCMVNKIQNSSLDPLDKAYQGSYKLMSIRNREQILNFTSLILNANKPNGIMVKLTYMLLVGNIRLNLKRGDKMIYKWYLKDK